MKMNSKTGASVAAAAATLFLAGAALAPAAEAHMGKSHHGMHSCKGKHGCKGVHKGKHGCKGMHKSRGKHGCKGHR